MTNDIVELWSREFGMRPSIENTKHLMEILAATKNPHKHRHQDLAALVGSMETVGVKNIIMLWQNPETGKPEVVYGGGRIQAGNMRGEERLPVVWALDFDKAKAKFLRVADNRVQQLAPAYDDDILIDHLKDLKIGRIDYDFLKFDKFDRLLIDDVVKIEENLGSSPQFSTMEAIEIPRSPNSTETNATTPIIESRPPINTNIGEKVPTGQADAFSIDFSSSNEWGIPDLSLKYQATHLNLPFVKWGEISGKKEMNGTWHFYVDDEKFQQIADNPDTPLRSMPNNLVELNYSTYETMPKALAIGSIFFKRWVSRYWQSKAFNVIVDLNVVPRFSEINLIGVPQGWQAYATRGSGSIDYVKNDWEMACDHSGADEADIFFIVYGGGQRSSSPCR